MKSLRRLLAVLLSLALPCLMLACMPGNNGDVPTFDYTTADMTQYVSFGEQDYRDVAFSVKGGITDADVKADFNQYFASSSNPYYLPVQDATRAVAEGDYLYLLYSGVTVSALEKAVSEGLLPDVQASGLSYTQILDLNLGFSGGTTNALIPLLIGSGQFIDGFEEGLVGTIPTEHGEEDPVRLSLTFPENYSSDDLAGQDVIFFCKLYYIGDTTAGFYHADQIDTAMLNRIMGYTGTEKAYASVEACLEEIRAYLEKQLADDMPSAKARALYDALVDMATFTNLPAQLVKEYIDGWFETRFAYVQSVNPQLYAYYFAENRSRDLLAQLYGYGEDYMTELTSEANQAIRQEMVYRYILQTGNYTVNDEAYAKWDALYREKYGEDYRSTAEEGEVREQMLRDEVTETLLQIAEERGHITYIDME